MTVAGSNGVLSFEVRDDGIGFDPDKVTRGPGLVNLTDRLDALEGTLEIESDPGHGTSVRGTVPIGELEQV